LPSQTQNRQEGEMGGVSPSSVLASPVHPSASHALRQTAKSRFALIKPLFYPLPPGFPSTSRPHFYHFNLRHFFHLSVAWQSRQRPGERCKKLPSPPPQKSVPAPSAPPEPPRVPAETKLPAHAPLPPSPVPTPAAKESANAPAAARVSPPSAFMSSTPCTTDNSCAEHPPG
jgi:hypothetical protein